MPSTVEQNAFGRPPLLALFLSSPSWMMYHSQAAIWKQLACERLHRANKNTTKESLSGG